MTAIQTAPTEVAASRRRRWVILALLAGAQLMLVLDVTVVNVALPDIGAALRLSRSSLPWVLTAYTLAFGGLMLLGGRVADLLGARRVMLSGLAVFTASSLVCAISSGPAELLAGRAMQGLAAAFLSPAALSLVMAAFPGPERSKALAIWSSLAGAGSALGVILGGVLTSTISWRWIFAINVPIGAITLLLLPRLTRGHQPARGTDVGLDVPGGLLVTAGTGAAIYGLVNAGSHGWSATSTLAALLVAAALWGVFVLAERRIKRPLLAVSLLRRRPVTGGALVMIAATGLLVGGFFLGSFELQRVFGYSAVHVGLAFLPIALATILGAQAAGHALKHLDTRTIAVTGLILAAAGYGIALWLNRAPGIIIGLAVAALGIGACFITAFTASLTDAAQDEAGLRSAIVGTFHELGGALGVATLSAAAGAALTATQVDTSDFTRAFAIGAIAALISVVLAAAFVPAVKRPAGQSGHSHAPS